MATEYRSELTRRVIPCLDVTDGRVVKGVNFVDLRDAGDPVEVARRYDAEGADELTFLDITASSDQRDTILHVIEAVAQQVFIPLTVGGGIRSVDDIRRLLNVGADKVSVNTAAIHNPQLVADAALESFLKILSPSREMTITLLEIRMRALRSPKLADHLERINTETRPALVNFVDDLAERLGISFVLPTEYILDLFEALYYFEFNRYGKYSIRPLLTPLALFLMRSED